MSEMSAVPVGCWRNTLFNIGSGFIVAEGGHRLITAVHTAQLSQPTSQWVDWPLNLSIFVRPDDAVAEPMFLGSAVRIPRFRYRHGESWPSIDDAIVLPIKPETHTRLTVTLTVVQLSTANHSLEIGQILTGYGFPDLSVEAKWPYDPPSTTSGIYLGMRGPLISAKLPITHGFSGGPVFDEDERFVGMMIGSTNGVTDIVPASYLARL
jgi:hypothetical protein